MGRLTSQDRQKEIIDTSLKIIFEQGINNLTMRNIASHIGISEAALYKHFQSKQQVIESLVDFYFSERMFNEKINIDGDFEKVIHSIFYHKFSWLEDIPELSAIIFQEEMFREFPDIRAKFINHRRMLESQISKLIEVNQDSGIILENIDPKTFSIIITGSVRISVLRWKEENFSYSLTKEAEKLTDSFVKTLKVNDL